MSKPRTEKRRSTTTVPRAATLSETELQKQRADSEGMTPNKPQHQNTLANEGEGNRTADRRYRQGVKRFLTEGRMRGAAKKTERAVDGLVQAFTGLKRAQSK